MTDRPSGQGPPNTSHSDDQQNPRSRPPSSALYPQQSTSNSPSELSPLRQRQWYPPSQGLELPSLPQALIGTGGSFSPPQPRATAFSTILNPVQSEDLHQTRRRKASELEGPPASTTALPPLSVNTQYASSSARALTPSISASYGTPRRILTPRSPSLHRAASLGQLYPATATFSAQQSPFLPSPRSRVYTIEPGVSGAPPLPTPTAASRPNYGFSAPALPAEAARRSSAGTGRASRAASPSASPSPSYSSYSQPGQTPPATQYGSATSAPYSTAGDAFSGPGASGALLDSAGHDRQRPLGIPVSSSAGQNVYQMMTLETTSGTVQLPVDVQAASRVADEKRRRNAGASARFRQRRKEKEKEASTTIAKLEQEAKELSEHLDFYKRERDYLAAVVLQTPGGERHFPRPASPRRRISSSALAGHSGMAGRAYSAAQEQYSRSPEEDRNVRRRTSTVSLPAPGPPAVQSAMSLQSPGTLFPSGYNLQYGPPLIPHTNATLQAQFTGQMLSPLSRGPMAAPMPQSSAPTQQHSPHALPRLMHGAPPGPWNPYAADQRNTGPPGPRESR